MTTTFPSRDIAHKFATALSNDNGAISSTQTVPAANYGVIYKLWVDLDVTDETDLENLVDPLTVSVTIGSTVWSRFLHPYIARTADNTTNIEHIDLGPWPFDFGLAGLYSGVKGDNIIVAVVAAGTGIKTKADYIYSN